MRRRRLAAALVLLALGVASGPGQGQALQAVHLEQPSGLRATRWSAAGSTSKTLPAALTGGQVDLPWPCDASWIYHLWSPTAFSWPFSLAPSDCEATDPVDVAFVPGATFRVRLQIPPGSPAPPLAEVTGRQCAGTAPEPRASFRYVTTLDPPGELRGPVPAGCVDLRLTAEGYQPVPLLATEVAAGQEVQLGVRSLARATILKALAVAAWNSRPLAGVRALLVPSDRFPSVSDQALGGEKVPGWRTVTSDAEGRLVEPGLAPGTWGVVLEADAPDVARVALAPREFASGQTVDLGRIDLPAAAHLIVEVDPALLRRSEVVDGTWRPTLQLARVVPSEAGETMRPPRERAVDENGAAILWLAPGPRVVELALVTADGHSRFITSERVELAAGEVKALALADKGHRFAGFVEWKGERVAHAELSFLPADPAAPGVMTQPTATTDDEGRFDVSINWLGIYDVRLSWLEGERERHRDAQIEGVELRDPSATIELQVSSASLAGRVVNRDGAPVADALVEAVRLPASGGEVDLGPSAWTADHSDAQGAFALDALAPGRWQVEARADGQSSRPLTRTLAEDENVFGLVLELAPNRELRGRLLLSGQPLADTRALLLWPPSRHRPLGHLRPITTDETGRFVMEQPEGAPRRALLMVPAPARVVGARWVDLDPASPFEVSFRQPTGGAELRPAGGAWTDDVFPSTLVLTRADGVAVFAVAVGEAAQSPLPGSRSPYGLANLEPGVWQVRRLPRVAHEALTRLATGQAHTFELLGEIVVSAGTARIEVPTKATP